MLFGLVARTVGRHDEVDVYLRFIAVCLEIEVPAWSVGHFVRACERGGFLQLQREVRNGLGVELRETYAG